MILPNKGEDAKPKFLEQIPTILRPRGVAENVAGSIA